LGLKSRYGTSISTIAIPTLIDALWWGDGVWALVTLLDVPTGVVLGALDTMSAGYLSFINDYGNDNGVYFVVTQWAPAFRWWWWGWHNDRISPWSGPYLLLAWCR